MFMATAFSGGFGTGAKKRPSLFHWNVSADSTRTRDNRISAPLQCTTTGRYAVANRMKYTLARSVLDVLKPEVRKGAGAFNR